MPIHKRNSQNNTEKKWNDERRKRQKIYEQAVSVDTLLGYAGISLGESEVNEDDLSRKHEDYPTKISSEKPVGS